MSALAGSLSTTGSLSGALSSATLSGSLSVSAPTYSGAYTFTPTTEDQIVEIANRVATQDITIEAIPNYYGLITWDGSTITVS